MHLVERYQAIPRLPASRRGPAFEELLAEAFRLSQFIVDVDPGAARPRQSDLMIRRGRDRYLIEAKHQARPAGVEDVDELRVRLERMQANVTGVLISRAGFSVNARQLAADDRRMPIILICGEELESLLAGQEDLGEALAARREVIITHGGRPPARDDRLLEPLRSLGAPVAAWITDIDGEPLSHVPARGTYGAPVHVLALEDIDWTPTPGFGVTMDVQLPVADQDELIAVFGRLAASGWVSGVGAWTIEQLERVWHGMGAGALVLELGASETRLSGLSHVHHREIVTFADQRAPCAWTLQADVESVGRRVWSCELSLAFPGVPLDLEPLTSVLGSLGARVGDLNFRPRSQAAVRGPTASLPRRGPALEVLGRVVQQDRDEDWVCRLVVRSPFRRRRPAGVDDAFTRSEAIVAALRSWHPATDRPTTYRLVRLEWMRSSHCLVSHAMADWD